MVAIPDIALSVRQPWANAIIFGGKDFENRSQFALNHMNFEKLDGGLLAIHASSGMTKEEYLNGKAYCRAFGYEVPHPADLAYGAIIGTVRVLKSGHFKVACSKWKQSETGLLLADPMPLEKPISASGTLGLFKWQNDCEPRPLKPWMEKYGRESLPKPPTTARHLS